MSPTKTNAVRLLEKLGVRFELKAYEVDESDLSAESVAVKVGLPVKQMFKTILCRGDRTGACFAVVPGDAEVDLKALAKASGNRKCETVPLREVQPLTGYIRGGVTALGAKKNLPVFLDAMAPHHALISISAGVRGTQVFLRPDDYVRATGAHVAPITRKKDAAS